MLRRLGEASVQPSGNAPALDDLRGLARRALVSEGERGLLALRAVQSELFVQAARGWAASGKPAADLRELGGEFPELATMSGWRTGSTLVLTDDELGLLFRMRWNELTGLAERPSFALTLDELRARYSLLLRHPSGPDAATRIHRQLGYVTALEKLDHDYPVAFARGVLFYRAADYESAAAAFQTHLALHPNGPWTLRAQNHLLQALARLDDG
ncbi:MAG TPA: hypothetical protein VGQ57_08090 [Polyangiaceae bacterium]|nr:hypothetical protein [Polyangiaceae bacterium]